MKLTAKAPKTAEQKLEEAINSIKSYNLEPEHEAQMIAKVTKKALKDAKKDKKWAKREAAAKMQIETCNPNELGEINKARAFAQWNR